jgi:type III secretion protein N (ATPase)
VARRDGSLVDAEVIAFDEDSVTLMPLGSVHGVGPDDAVYWLGSALSVPCSPALLGRVVDGIGRPLDGGPALTGEPWAIVRAAPAALERPRITRVLPTGVSAIDALCTVGEGQRMGLFAPAGVGKTSLLGRLAEHADADVIVTCLIGERGRELNEYLEDALGTRARARSVVVCATSDASALERVKSAQLATTFAEFFRARGQRVLLLIDSLTRLVRAAREVGLSAGEPPARRGFPASAFSELAPLLERAGLTKTGSITAFYTVLVEGNDLDEPVSDEVRGLLDGHLVLDRTLAQRGHYPPIDISKSLSRLMHAIVTPSQHRAAEHVRELLAHYESRRDLVELGAVQRGADPRLERAIEKLPAIEKLLRQERGVRADYADTLERLLSI